MKIAKTSPALKKQLCHRPWPCTLVVTLPQALYNGLGTALAQWFPPILAGGLFPVGCLQHIIGTKRSIF